MRRIGIVVFVLGCVAIAISMGFVIRTYFWRNPDGRVGEPPMNRGFSLEVGKEPASDYAAAFLEMRKANATAVLLIDGHLRSDLATLVNDARVCSLTPWLAIAPQEDPAAYSTTAMEAARACAANHIAHIALGQHTEFDFDDDEAAQAYWDGLAKDVRAAAPGIKITLVANFQGRLDYLFFPSWASADIMGVTGDFDLPKDKAKDGFFHASWSAHVANMLSYAAKQAGISGNRPKGAAMIDVEIPRKYSFESAETLLRTLIHQTKRQAATTDSKAPPRSRDPLQALFIRGWKLGDKTGLHEHLDVFQSDWRDDAPFPIVTLPEKNPPKTATAPASATGIAERRSPTSSLPTSASTTAPASSPATSH